MARKPAAPKAPEPFNIVIVGQNGRLGYEAVIFAASLRHHTPDFKGRLLVAEPQAGPLWPNDPTLKGPVREALLELGAEIIPFHSVHFGAEYPYGNKIEMLTALPKGEPFVFFDTDTLVTGDLLSVPFDFERPSASLRREGTWPLPPLYGPGFTGIWKALYERFGLDFESSLDTSEPDEYWRRYLYFNAGFFYYKCPHAFGEKLFLELRGGHCASDAPHANWPVRNNGPMAGPGGPAAGDPCTGRRSRHPARRASWTVPSACHYRLFPMLYAREGDHVVDTLEAVVAPNKIKKVLKGYDTIKRMIYQGRGEKVRALFDRENLPRREQAIRNKIKSEGFWMR